MMRGGESKGKPPKGMIPEQEAMGIEVEYEHTSDWDIARKIAWDHLAEFDTYYDALDEMEKRLEEEKKAKSPVPEKVKETVGSVFKDKRFWWVAIGSIAFGAILAVASKN
jgi:hypothetical protein